MTAKRDEIVAQIEALAMDLARCDWPTMPAETMPTSWVLVLGSQPPPDPGDEPTDHINVLGPAYVTTFAKAGLLTLAMDQFRWGR